MFIYLYVYLYVYIYIYVCVWKDVAILIKMMPTYGKVSMHYTLRALAAVKCRTSDELLEKINENNWRYGNEVN